MGERVNWKRRALAAEKEVLRLRNILNEDGLHDPELASLAGEKIDALNAVTNAEELLTLTERVEKAPEGIDLLDCEITVALSLIPGATVKPSGCLHVPGKGDFGARRFTTSLDAAITLVPEGHVWTLQKTFTICDCTVFIGQPFRELARCRSAATPTLALTAACLRALANRGNHG